MKLTKPQRLIYDMEKFAGGTIAVICGSILFEGKREISALQAAVNCLYRLNDALRIRIVETPDGVQQEITAYSEQTIPVLSFHSKTEMTAYAESYAKEPLHFPNMLCEITVVLLPEQYGIIAKLHHIISDAWTLALIGTQLHAILNGETPTAYSYTNYLEKEEAYLQSARYEKDQAFFLEQFRQCDEMVYLSEKQGTALSACRKTFVIGAGRAKEITDYVTRRKTSAFTLFMAVLAVYLSRTKMNAERFYIGTAILNRSGVKEKNTMGMYVNTVPMLAEPDNEKSFAENLTAIEKSVLSVLRHQKYNYSDILSGIRKAYGFGEKLYDVLLSYQNAAVIGTDFETAWYHSGMQNESLQIHIDDRDGEGIFCIHYDYLTDRFTEQEIDMLHQHIEVLLFDAIRDDRKKLYDLALLTPVEKRKLLYDFNDTVADYPREKCVHTLFEEQAARTPDKTAVIACDGTLTYRELNEQANRIAHGLMEKGVKPGDIVAFALPRRSYLIAAMFGILKAGAAYLPIDPDYPQERIDYMLKDSRTAYCIAKENIGNLLSNINNINPACIRNSNDIFCALHTSGSTGKPKMAALKHSCMLNFLTANKRFWKGIDTVVSATIVTFDAFTMESVLSVLQGYRLVLGSEEDIYNQAKFENLFAYSARNMFFSTPTKIENYIENSSTKQFLSRIGSLVIGGEVFSNYLLGQINTYSGETRVYNIYGPTETTICALVDEVDAGRDITIGKPIANTQIYIVDKYLRAVPIGVTGELCVAGDGVGEGYLNRPELTAEKFVDNPFGKGRLYKTGDLAYWREDGNIVYVGRNDFQVKIRGLRIELGEIENALCGVDGISQAVVVVRKNSEGRQLICAFYTGTETDAKEIRAQLGKTLPKYMLPHCFTHLDAMPLTTSGKVNRNALPEIDLYAIDTTAAYTAPSTEQEKKLVSAIEAILGLEKVGMLDNFFDLGGDSLKAIELISKLESLGWHTETKTIFECSNIKELAEKVTAAEAEEEEFTFTGDVPATPAQMRVYTAQGMCGGSTTYNVPYIFKVKELDAERLQAAVDALVARHEILRTHFENKDGSIIQIIHDTAMCRVEKLDTGDISAFIRPFDLSKAPLLRVGCYGNTVMIDMHHIITDGSSMPVFLHELNELYMGRTLTDTPVQYKQFAVQRKDYTESETYWLTVYHDEIPVLEINTDFKRGQKQSFHGSAIYDSVSRELHDKILEKCKAWNITPYVFYMGAFYVLLSQYSGAEDIVVGTPASGRTGKYLNTLGMFVNTIALRNQPLGSKSVQAFLAEVKENSVNALAYQDYPFGELVKKLNVNGTGRNPLFDVMFAYQSEQMTDVVFGDQKAELLPIPITTSKYDFTFNVMPRENDVILMVEYCTELYREHTMQRFVDGYKQLLEQMLNPCKAIKELSAIVPVERQRLLYEFNDTAADYPREKCVHTLFEEQAARTPDKTAVIACDGTLTYRELNEQANRIAHGLMEKGVKPGDIVAFALPRRSYLIAAMFGILKVGAAYLPIDPDYPQDRIDYMLSDSKAKYYLTNAEIAVLLRHGNASNPQYGISSRNLCYCIYTSGSTGKPKAAAISHANVSNFVFEKAGEFQQTVIRACDCVFATNAIVFDITVQDILLPLLNGLYVAFAETETPEMVTAFLSHAPLGRSALIITPTKLQMYMQSQDFCDNLNRFSVLMVGAETFQKQLYHELRRYTQADIFNGYGPTETTCGVLYAKITEAESISIGKPIANTQIYIVDKYLRPVPIGVTGELCIAGDGVGAGYLNRPELTAEKFVDNPFGKGKLYKTGDLAYWREDGNIVYVGRNDFQVKIRGLRIELGEIENALCGVDGISQAVVVVRKNSEGRQLICAFYTGTEQDAKEIRALLGKTLPKYMLPHCFTHLDTMPLTTSGKVNRKALPEIDLAIATSNTEYVPPKNQRQKELCKLMERVLGTSPIGITDSFFDLGGDSLKAIEFVSKAHSEGIYFNLQNIFDYPSVEELSACIENGDRQEHSFADRDFTAVNAILEKNQTAYITAPKAEPLGNILLAGATGYLGIHILADFLDKDDGIAYCLVRGKDAAQSKQRLRELLTFYFGRKYEDMRRIEVVCADLQKELFGLAEQEYEALLRRVDTVINAAASVKHYGSYRYFYESNVETVKRLIAFCNAANAKLIHTSTLSVSGNTFGDDFDGYISKTEKHFDESSLYIGQPLENVYARSKFEAELEVLEAMRQGLRANIMRMGNLSNRLSDGVFQKNHETNAALRRITAILELGCVPEYLMDIYAEFTPIDEAASAVMTLTRHFSSEQTVFHINSTKVVYMDRLLEYFNALGYPLKTVSGAEFTAALRETAKRTDMEHIFETFINDMDENEQLNYDSNIRIENDFTVQCLKNLGFAWSDIDLSYFKKYAAYFKKIGYWK